MARGYSGGLRLSSATAARKQRPRGRPWHANAVAVGNRSTIGNGLIAPIKGKQLLAVDSSPRRLAPHDLRRTCARLCHGAGNELEQIQFLLGHASVQTTERYIGCKQKLKDAVNDGFGISLKAAA